MAEFHRFTISITKELKARMDRATDVNWSSVAREAFESKLAEMARLKDVKVNTKTLERMRQSKKKEFDDVYQDGWKCAKKWIHGHGKKGDQRLADYGELKNLAEAEIDFEALAESGSVFPISQIVFGALKSSSTPEFNSDHFWKLVCGKGFPNMTFVKGFVESALAEFEEIKKAME